MTFEEAHRKTMSRHAASFKALTEGDSDCEPLQTCKGCGRHVEQWYCDDCEDGGSSIK